MVVRGGFCVDREARDQGVTGVARVDFYQDGVAADAFFTGTVMVSLILLLVLEVVNRIRLRRAEEGNEPYLLLPSYFHYLTAMMGVNVIFVIIFITFETAISHSNKWIELVPVSLQYGMLHFFFEAPTYFFMRGGAAQRDVNYAIVFGGMSFIVAFAVLMMCGHYASEHNNTTRPFVLYMGYQGSITALYASIVCFPNCFIARRPALLPYARCMLFYNVAWISVSFGLHFGSDSALCSAYIVTFFLDGLYPPLMLYYAFIMDSQYWQGCLNLNIDNPMAGLWEVDIEVMSTMSSSMHQPSTMTKTIVPAIHFGMLSIDSTSFASGGFSRVYQAQYKNNKVAVKLLFAMELNKESIIKFYKEAQILKDLKHKNIVDCIGVTVMPPAVGVVMEYCMYGSLFDFLYENGGIVPESSVSSLWRSSSMSRLSVSQRKSTARQSFSSSFSSRVVLDSPMSNHAMMQDYQMMLDAASGLAHMHSFGFMHCDVKSLNYLVTDNLQLKLSDFGEVRSVRSKDVNGRPPKVAAVWCSPELLVSGATAASYTPAADIFSLAMVMSEIMTKQLPMENINADFNHDSWYQAIAIRGMRPVIPNQISSHLRSLVECAWSTDPSKRPGALDLCLALASAIRHLENGSDLESSGCSNISAASAIVSDRSSFSAEELGFEMRQSCITPKVPPVSDQNESSTSGIEFGSDEV